MVRIVSYRRHKPTGQARVALGGNDFYLGRYGTRESKEAYQRVIGEYVTSQGRPPAPEHTSRSGNSPRPTNAPPRRTTSIPTANVDT